MDFEIDVHGKIGKFKDSVVKSGNSCKNRGFKRGLISLPWGDCKVLGRGGDNFS